MAVRIILVDDEADLLEAMEELLTESGYEVAAFTSPHDALDDLENRQTPPALIITDVTMPGMSGGELLETVRQQPEWAHIPFLFISATKTLGRQQPILDLPNVDYLPKPFDVVAFYEKVDTIIAP